MRSSESTADTVKRVIRASLQLDPEVTIADDMALSGGEHDPDSLDMLLIVTSLEREFGIKIPNDRLGTEMFSSVQTIVSLIERERCRE